MCPGFAPIKTGTPVSRLDSRASVVDTGTQRRETDLLVEVVIVFSVTASGIGVSEAGPNDIGVPASVLSWSRKINTRSHSA